MKETILTDDPYKDEELKLIFKEEYDSNVPSAIIQAIAKLFHPKSELYSLPLTEKIQIVNKDFLTSEKLDLDKYGSTIDKFKKFILTKAERSLVNWEQKLEERDAFMAGILYNEDSFEMLDKMMMQTAKMWDQYAAVRKVFLQEEEAQTHGDVEESAVEKGLI